MTPIDQIVERLEGDTKRAILHGAGGSYLAFVLAQLCQHPGQRDKPLMIVADDEKKAKRLADDLRFFLSKRRDSPIGAQAEVHPDTSPRGQTDLPCAQARPVVYLPSPATSPYAETSVDRTNRLQRVGALAQVLYAPGSPIAVCHASTLMRRVVSPEVMRHRTIDLAVGDGVERDQLVAALLAAGYERYPVVDDQGTFAVRGGIIDFFSPLCRFPFRIELFGDEIESIRSFDSTTQRTLRRVDGASIVPTTELLRDDAVSPRDRLLALADTLHFPTRSARTLIEQLECNSRFLGVETLLPAISGDLVAIWRYLRPDAVWVVLEPQSVLDAIDAELEHAASLHGARIEAGHLAFDPEAFYLDRERVENQLEAMATIEVGLSTSDDIDDAVLLAVEDNASLVAQLKRARIDKASEIIGTLARFITERRGDGCGTVIAASDPAEANKLLALLATHGVAGRMLEDQTPFALLSAPPPGPEVYLAIGDLGCGFTLKGRWIVTSHDELFGARTTRRPAIRIKHDGRRIGDLGDLEPGDLMVHAEHGLGRYGGLVNLEVGGVRADFLLLEYARGDRLYLPVHRMRRVQRYIGAGGAACRLDRLGGSTWQRRKDKVAADVRHFGEQLLQLYAQRSAMRGHAFPPPGNEYAEFEQSFEFTETPDQLQTIDQVISDLTSERPMDRLICGDVGFGKTEVALRAAFMAAMSGCQVAVLAPTTVLVEQHYRRFSARLSAYPLRVEAISRFRRPTELRAALGDIATGKVDLAIGTHRLLSPDVRFKRLGLLIIDEEQRFGVAHKERIKQLRSQVDILALTATPIPRTLQLGMAGLREISVIATPPDDRLAIRTVICSRDDAVVTDAIRRELSRQGQVFFVHNDISTIEHSADHLRKLVPEARICVAHGKMDPRLLERVMLAFVRGDHDILVCTTIIESGLDIPRANTMFVDQAHRFGLSQLYQLRGRIGRSNRRAYCYLVVPTVREMTPEARQRLEVLQRFTALGSGFSIASHDLELRGAGDLLGKRQSGHVASVGFDTYAQILEEAVAELKGTPIQRETDPDLNTYIAAFIPDDYVEDIGQRLALYQRLSDSCTSESSVYALREEIVDRYGPLPAEVEDLCELMVVKGLAMRLRALTIDLSASRLAITLDAATPLPADRVAALVSQPRAKLRLETGGRLIERLDSGPSPGMALGAAQASLRRLLALCPELS